MKKIFFQTALLIFASTFVFSLTAFGAADSTDGGKDNSPTSVDLMPPTGLTLVAVGKDSVDISWDTVEGASAYYVYRNGKMVNRVTGSNYIDVELNNTSVYRYQIQAIYKSGESPRSESKCVRTWQKATEGVDGAVVCPPLHLRVVVSK
jgi:hypothetical protein